MNNQKSNAKFFTLISVLGIFIAALLLSGCGEEPECQLTSECSQKECYTTTCVEGQCDAQPITNCCGNGMCEKSAGESACGCPEDCAAPGEECKGDVVIFEDRKYTEYSDYLQYGCNAREECVVEFKTEQKQKVFSKDIELSHATIEFKTNFLNPFDITKDQINLEMRLLTKNDDLELPIKFSRVQVLKKNSLMGELSQNLALNSVGDSFSVNIPITYDMTEVEEELELSIKINYEYDYVIDKDGNTKTKTNYIQEYINEDLIFAKIGEPRE